MKNIALNRRSTYLFNTSEIDSKLKAKTNKPLDPSFNSIFL